MAISKRQGAVFVSGFLLGVAAVAGARKKLAEAALRAPDEAGAIPPPQSVPAGPSASVPSSPGGFDKPLPNVAPSQAMRDRSGINAPPPQPRTDEPGPSVPPSRPLPDKPTASVPPRTPGAPATRQRAFLASGLVLAAAVVGAWVTLGSESSRVAGKPKTSVAAPESSQLSTCSSQPVAATGSGKDGRFPLMADVSGLIAADIGNFLLLGKEFAASGQPRDAEVAFLMSCRVADKFRGAGSAESADARYQLGSHYARVALAGENTDGPNRAELFRRAELFLADSSQAYVAKYGKDHEKSRFASKGLTTVRQTLAQAGTGQPAPVLPAPDQAPADKVAEATAPAAPTVFPQVPDQRPAAKAAEAAGPATAGRSTLPEAPVPRVQPRPVKVAKATPPTAQTPRATTQFKPSFDCGKARSFAEKMICSDAELAQLDRELVRMYARAKSAAVDRAAFQRHSDQEWRRRESMCRDRNCLLRWYALRRNQLMNVTEGRGQSQPMASRGGMLTGETSAYDRGK